MASMNGGIRKEAEAIWGLWVMSGSKRVDWGFITWGVNWSNQSRMHRQTMCRFAFTKNLSQVDVFEHPELGRYIVHPRTGERTKALPFCKTCDPNKPEREPRSRRPDDERWNAKRRGRYASRLLNEQATERTVSSAVS